MAALTYRQPALLSVWPSYTITMLNGKDYTLYCASIIPSIEQAIIRRELPGMLTRYKAGATLSLGTISLNQEGISHNVQASKKATCKGLTLKWSEVRQCVDEGHTLLSFAKVADDQSLQISLYGVRNAGTVRALVSYATSPLVECVRQQEKKLSA